MEPQKPGNSPGSGPEVGSWAVHTTETASSAPRLASSSAASFSGRNECPGTHCSLIEQEEREDSSCQICHRV